MSLVWPVREVQPGEVCSRDFVPLLFAHETHEQRAARREAILSFTPNRYLMNLESRMSSGAEKRAENRPIMVTVKQLKCCGVSVLELSDHCFNSCSQAIAENVLCSKYTCGAACHPEEDKSLLMGAP